MPLVVEYEDALLRHARTAGLTHSDCREVIDYICRVSRHQEIFFLWRPLLRDPNDDMVAELAVAANCEGIVTYNQRDFEGVQTLGLRVFTPADLLREVGELS